MSESTSIIGRWRITEMDNWDQEAVDLVQPDFIEFDDDGLGGLGFIVVTGEGRFAPAAARQGAPSASHQSPPASIGLPQPGPLRGRKAIAANADGADKPDLGN